MIQNILGLLPIKIWKGIVEIRDLAEIQSGIRENAKILDGLGELTATRDSPNSCTGKKTVFGVEITKVCEKGEGRRAPFLTLAHENTI